MRSIASSKPRDVFPPPDCNRANEAPQCIHVGLLQDDVENHE